MPIETRWYRNEQTTVNGLTAYLLALAKITTQYTFSRAVARYVTSGYICIDIYKRSADGTETLIASKVAQVQTLDGDSYDTKSATVNIPASTLNTTDSIVIRVYWRFADETSWTLCATFTTEQLNAAQLDASTWTCYYTVSHTSQLSPLKRSAMNFHIDGTNLSRIEGFSWSVPAAGFRALQYITEPPTAGWNKLKYAVEPPVAGAWNKLLYQGE